MLSFWHLTWAYFPTLIQVFQGSWTPCWFTRLWSFFGHVESWFHVCWNGMYDCKNAVLMLILLDTITQTFCQLVVGNSFFNMIADWWLQIFRKEPFFYGHDNHDQLVKIAKVSISLIVHSTCFWDKVDVLVWTLVCNPWFDCLFRTKGSNYMHFSSLMLHSVLLLL